jgi:hypothetical protein
VKQGVLEKVGVDNGASFRISGREFLLPHASALAILGIQQLPPGVLPQTAISLKSQAYEGRKVSYLQEGGSLAWLKLSE